MNFSHPQNHRRGFTLTEMLAVIILFSAFAIIAERLITTTWRVSYNASQSQNAATSIESAINVLRSDVWSAQTITTKDVKSVELKRGDGHLVTWSIDGGKFSRRDGAREDHWQAPPGASLSSDGTTLILNVADPKKDIPVNQVQMVSQLLLAAKMNPK